MTAGHRWYFTTFFFFFSKNKKFDVIVLIHSPFSFALLIFYSTFIAIFPTLQKCVRCIDPSI